MAVVAGREEYEVGDWCEGGRMEGSMAEGSREESGGEMAKLEWTGE